MRVAVLATGVGNVRSVLRALGSVVDREAEIIATADPELVRRADVLVVPGQGSFGAFTAALSSGLDQVLIERIRAGTPYLGICLGLQILFEASEEAPGARGLAILPGRVHRLAPGIDEATKRQRPLPHVGWNLAAPSVAASDEGHPNDPLVGADHYYFAHTYAATPEDPSITLATTEYGETFASAIRRDNVVGVQFHPEKSQRAGLALLARFFTRTVGIAGIGVRDGRAC
jgi:imidazole glycerol-phosphate synthase subunit HisH